MNQILIVEDDEIIGGGVKFFLEQKGFDIGLAGTISMAHDALNKPWDLILLDQMLPDGTGLELCKEIRKNSNVPIIFLTAMDTNADMIEGFRAGCDDYISKPFDVEILYQRIQAVLRRSANDSESELFHYEDMTVDFSKMQVRIGEEYIKLSATEYKLLELLIKNKGQVLTRQNILERIWDCDENFVDENTLNVHIRRLRKKIEPDDKTPKYIVTVFGIGYTFGE